MLGFSGIRGINGLTGTESNSWHGVTYRVSAPATDPMNVDPFHEFEDVVEQLCGAGVTYPPGGPYPPINNTGYVANFNEKAVPNAKTAPKNIDDVMRCFHPSRLHNLNWLASNFAVCDSWFSSMPGPTWPNRFFAVAASSGGLDKSPDKFETALWSSLDGFEFEHGTLFDIGRSLLSPRGKLKWRIYAGHKLFALAHALKGIHIWDITRYSKFATDVSDPNYPAKFTWIEPHYGSLSDFTGGNSQHPLDPVGPGEALIKATYEAIRNSPLWESSMLIITYDEHGGFYDHVEPPPAIPPGDKQVVSGANKHGFVFDQYGPRVPTVVVSPLIPPNTVDRRPCDHASIPATVERLFNLPPLTARDRAANDLLPLTTLSEPRTDLPPTIPPNPEREFAASDVPLDALEQAPPAPDEPDAPVVWHRQLAGFLYVLARTDAELRRPLYLRPMPDVLVRRLATPAVLETVLGINTQGQLHAYLRNVQDRLFADPRAAQ